VNAAVVLEQGQKTFLLGDRPVPVLRGVDLEIRVGEMVAVMGASGSGKTTLLAILGLLESLSAGRYFLFGRDTAGWSPEERARVRNREIGFVFQNFNLLPRLTAWQNVALPLLYAGVPAARRRQRAMELLGLVGLAAFADHLPSQLSGGQQQRVAVARALANNPSLLLADEPTGQLDTRSGLEVLALIQELHRATGATVVMVTHDPEVALFCRRIVRLRDGRVVGCEEVAEPADAAARLRELPPEGGEGAA